MRKGKLYISILLGLCLCLFTAFGVACKDENSTGNSSTGGDSSTEEPATPTLESISVSGETEVFIDEFDYADYTITATYSDDSTKTATLTADNLSADDNAKLSTVGTHSLTVSYESVTCSWTVTLKNYEFTGVTFDDVTTTYDGTAKTLAVSGLPTGAQVSYDKATSYTNAGEYTVKATVTLANYNPVELTATLTINKATYDMSAVIFADKTVTYDGQAHSIEATNLPQGVTAEYTGNKQINAGEYEITATFKGDSANYEPIASQTATLTINKATYDMSGVRFENTEATYDGQTHFVTATGLPSGVSVDWENNGKVNADTYTVTAKFTGDSTNYNAIPNQTATLTIHKATITGITFTGAEYTYDGKVKSLAIVGTLPNGVTVSYTGNNQTNAGEYTVTAIFTGDSQNYNAIQNMTATLTIKKATYDMSGVLFKDKSVNYNGQAHSIEATNLPNGVSVRYDGNGKTQAGEYTITAHFTGDSQNYNAIPNMMATLKISASDLTGISFHDGEFTYDGTKKSIFITGTLPDGVKVSYENNGQVNVDSYTVKAMFTCTNGNYTNLPELTATLTIKKATYDMSGVLFKDKSVNYNGQAHSIEATNLPNGVSVRYDGNGKTQAGEYTVTAIFTGDSRNYNEIPNMTATLKINASDLTGVSFHDGEFTYDGTKKSIFITGTLPDGVKVSYENNGQVNVDSYTVTATFTCTNGNYTNLPELTATLTIKKAVYDMSAVIFADKTVTYDGQAHSIEATNLPQGVTAEYTGNKQINAGEYEITATFKGDSANYEPIASKTATLTIEQRELTLAFNGETTLKYNGKAQKTITVQATNLVDGDSVELTVSYNGEMIEAGEYIATATLTAHQNYKLTANNTVKVTITRATHTVTFKQDGFADVTREVLDLADLTDIPEPKTVNGNAFTWDRTDFTSITEDITVTAQKTLLTYKIEYVLNGGTDNGNNPTQYTVESATFTLKAPTASETFGTTFGGWFTSPDFSLDSKITKIAKGTTGDLKLYAYWLEYRVTEVVGGAVNYSQATPEITIKVDYGTTNLAVKDLISVSDGCTWKLYTGFECLPTQELTAKRLSVSNIGDNIFYILVFHPDSNEYYTDYVLNVYQLDMKTYTFVKDGETWASGDIQEESALNAPENPEKDGYTFDGWKVNGEFVSFPYTVLTDTEFVAVYTPIEYTVTFKPNGGTLAQLTRTYTIETGMIFENLTREHYDFKGWYNSETQEGAATGIKIGTWGDFEFYAKWTPTEYTVTYYHNTVKEITSNSYTITNNSSSSWTESSGVLTSTNKTHSSSSIYKITANENFIVSFEYKVSSEQTYDKLIIAKNGATLETVSGSTSYVAYSVTLNAGDYLTFTYSKDGSQSSGDDCAYIKNLTYAPNGEVEKVTTQAYNIETPTFDLITPTRKSYTFAGWFTETTFENQATEIALGSHGNKKFYAKWTPTVYTIEYELNGGENEESNPETYTIVTATITLGNPTRSGYTFAGWFTEETFENQATEIVLGSYGDKKFYAKWTANLNTLKFDGNGATSGSMVEMSISTDETKALTANAFLKHYYRFIGWALTPDGDVVYADGAEYTMGTESEYTLYAVWEYGTNGIQYTLSNDKTYYTVSGYSGTERNVEIPSVYNGLPVTSIGERAFRYCSSLTSVVIPDSVTSISYQAFAGCSSLTSVVIPDSVTSIGNYAFDGCSSLTSVYITDIETWCNISFGNYSANPLYYAKNLYLNNELVTELTIPNTVTEIKSYAFAYCDSLTSVEIPDSVTSIGNYAFDGCSSLTSVYITDIETWCNISFGNYSANPLYYAKNLYLNNELVTELAIPNTVTEVKAYAFAYCSSLTSIEIPDGVTSIGSSAFSGCSSLTSVEIGDSVTSIGSSAFSGCSSLTSVEIGDSLTSIGNYAFAYCDSLTSVIIGNSVTSIGSWAFEDCSSLTSVYITDIEAWCNISGLSNLMAYGSSSKNLYLNNELVTELVIPNAVTEIKSYAFRGCSSLTSVEIGDGVTSIGGSAFAYCDSLTSIEIPDGVTSIGSSAFYNCSSLTSVVIPDSVTSISYQAFAGCSSLTSVVIPDGVTSIGNSAFSNCSSLTSVYITDIEAWCNISGVSNLMYYGSSNKNLYLDNELITELTIPNTVTEIKSYAFAYCDSLTSVTVSDSVTSIGRYAFYDCDSLKEMTLPFVGATKDGTSNTHFGYIFGSSSASDNNYYVPTSLKKVTVTGGNIGSEAFYNCSSLMSVAIGDSVTSIGYEAFYKCSSLTSVEIGDGVTSIGGSAFSNCDSLTSVEIPDSVTSIGDYAFRGCSSLTSVVIGDGVTSIGDYAFYYCDSLTEITLPFVGGSKDATGYQAVFGYIFGYTTSSSSSTISGATYQYPSSSSYKYYHYYIPTSLRKVTITGGNIGNSAFRYCSNLTSVVIGDGVTSIGSEAFEGCSSLTSVEIGDGVTSIGGSAFYSCDSLTSVEIGDSVTSIGVRAFYSCDSLTSVVIGDGVTSIGDYAFYYCDNLTSITVDENNTTYKSIDGNLYSKDGKTLIQYAIGKKVTSFTIPDSVTSIGEYAFYNCDSLTSVEIPDSVTSIGSSAFYDCDSLTIYCEAASRPSGWPSSWNAGGYSYYCPVVWDCNNNDVASDGYIYVMIDNLRYGIKDGVARVVRQASNIQTANIPTSITYKNNEYNVTSIGEDAFYYCSGLTSVVIPDSVTSIGEYAFYYCSSLTSIVIPDSVTSIGSYAFYRCSSLTSITVDEKNTAYKSIDGNLYSKDGKTLIQYAIGKKVTSFTIPDSVTSIGNYAFYYCNSLTSVVIPDSVTSIGNYAFAYCDSLTSVEIPDSVTSIGNYAFYYCNSLTSVAIPDGVTSIGESAFESCYSLTSITFEDTSTWYRTTSSTDWKNKTGGTSTSVTSSSTNATYFKSTYDDYYWYKK